MNAKIRTINPTLKNKVGEYGGSVHLATVPNTPAGRVFIADLRKSIKNSGTQRTVTIYGRGHRFGRGRIHVTADYKPKPGTYGYDNSFQSQLPRALASHLAIYIG